MNIKSLAITAFLVTCAFITGCASIPQSEATLHSKMSVNAATTLFTTNLQDCSGTISGIAGENVVVAPKGASSVLSLRSNGFYHAASLGTSFITDHVLIGLYTISPASDGGSVIYVKPNVSALKAGGFVSPSKRALAAAHLWLAGDNDCGL